MAEKDREIASIEADSAKYKEEIETTETALRTAEEGLANFPEFPEEHIQRQSEITREQMDLASKVLLWNLAEFFWL